MIMNVIAITPRVGEKGVIRFFAGYRRKFFFWSEPTFTLNADEAIRIEGDMDAIDLASMLNVGFKKKCQAIVLSRDELEKMSSQKFYAIECNGKCETVYYCGEELVYDKNHRKVMRQIPQYDGNIMHCEFFKGRSNAELTLNRIRCSNTERVCIREVYLTEKNDFTIPFVLFALKNKQTKRTRYLKGYDLDGKPSDRLFFVDSMEKAWKVDIPTMQKVIDDIHAKHKIFLVMPHIYDGRDIPADKYVDKRTGVDITFKFDN